MDPLNVFLVAAFVLHGLIEIYVFQGAPRQRMMTDSIFILVSAAGLPLRHQLTQKIKLTYAGFCLIAIGHTALRALGS